MLLFSKTPSIVNTTGIISKGPQIEGVAIFHRNDKYYLIGSHLTGKKTIVAPDQDDPASSLETLFLNFSLPQTSFWKLLFETNWHNCVYVFMCACVCMPVYVCRCARACVCVWGGVGCVRVHVCVWGGGRVGEWVRALAHVLRVNVLSNPCLACFCGQLLTCIIYIINQSMLYTNGFLDWKQTLFSNKNQSNGDRFGIEK